MTGEKGGETGEKGEREETGETGKRGEREVMVEARGITKRMETGKSRTIGLLKSTMKSRKKSLRNNNDHSHLLYRDTYTYPFHIYKYLNILHFN